MLTETQITELNSFLDNIKDRAYQSYDFDGIKLGYKPAFYFVRRKRGTRKLEKVENKRQIVRLNLKTKEIEVSKRIRKIEKSVALYLLYYHAVIEKCNFDRFKADSEATHLLLKTDFERSDFIQGLIYDVFYCKEQNEEIIKRYDAIKYLLDLHKPQPIQPPKL